MASIEQNLRINGYGKYPVTVKVEGDENLVLDVVHRAHRGACMDCPLLSGSSTIATLKKNPFVRVICSIEALVNLRQDEFKLNEQKKGEIVEIRTGPFASQEYLDKFGNRVVRASSGVCKIVEEIKDKYLPPPVEGEKFFLLGTIGIIYSLVEIISNDSKDQKRWLEMVENI